MSAAFPPDLLKELRDARHIAVLSGSGVSAESGIPTFRDALTGLWAQFDPEELATPEAFERNPALVWEWYAFRRALVIGARPNPAHLALAEMQRRAPEFTLVTQNVDGLHQLAGARGVIELHGNIRRVRCAACGRVHETWDASDVPPRCAICGGRLRPDVVWFGEMLPETAWTAATRAASRCDVFLSVGTSGVVEPAASLPRIAQRNGAAILHLNLDVTTVSVPPVYRIHGKAGEVLPALVQAAWGA